MAGYRQRDMDDDCDHPGSIALPRLDLLDPTVSPKAARTSVTDACGSWRLAQLADTASLLASELVTNAVRHAHPPISLHIRKLSARRIRVEVLDGSTASAQLNPNPDTTAVSGRGLFIIDALATHWGYQRAGDGKIVWFELAAG